MSQENPSRVIEALQWRYATKKFDPDKIIPPDILEVLLESLRLSPSSFGLQPWRFTLVKDCEVRRELRVYAWNQPQIVDASHLIAFSVKNEIAATDVDEALQNLSVTRGVPIDHLEEYRRVILAFISNSELHQREWGARQAYIALGTLLTSAAIVGIDTCPMEGFSSEGVDRLLGDSNAGYHTVVLCALGYRASDDWNAGQKKVRYPRERIFRSI
jgi:nitroreductase